MPALWCSVPGIILVLAAIADFLIGDPWGWPHPVQAMGWGIHHYRQGVWQHLPGARAQRFAGVLLGLGLPVGSGVVGWLLVKGVGYVIPFADVGCAVLLIASCFAGRSLRAAAQDVLSPLETDDLPEARARLQRYVGRDTDRLTKPEILRAVLETVSENATDGVLAPLFYALVGSAIAPFGGVSLALAYKALSTLDSMVGYREAPYTHLGWFSARSEDVATWLPCRLTVFTIALLSGQPRRVWRLCRRDAPADPSPNAGWSECAYAAALGVQLGGSNVYRGQVKQKPLLGDDLGAIVPATIDQALRLTRSAFLLWLTVGLGGLSLRYGLHCG